MQVMSSATFEHPLRRHWGVWCMTDGADVDGYTSDGMPYCVDHAMTNERKEEPCPV